MDKLAKIRRKIDSLLNDWKYVSSIEATYRCKVYKELLEDIDNIEEEPINDRFVFKAIPRLLEMIEPTDRTKAYTAKLADILDVEGYSTDAKIVRESLKVMNGEKVAMATMDEEPVNEELEEAAKYFIPDESYHMIIESKEEGSGENVYDYVQMIEMFKAGAKWQKVKDQETIELAEDHAMLAGMEKMREQMMKDAIDGYVIEDIEEGNGDFLLSADYLPAGMGLKDQQKVKVIVIKDE